MLEAWVQFDLGSLHRVRRRPVRPEHAYLAQVLHGGEDGTLKLLLQRVCRSPTRPRHLAPLAAERSTVHHIYPPRGFQQQSTSQVDPDRWTLQASGVEETFLSTSRLAHSGWV